MLVNLSLRGAFGTRQRGGIDTGGLGYEWKGAMGAAGRHRPTVGRASWWFLNMLVNLSAGCFWDRSTKRPGPVDGLFEVFGGIEDRCTKR